MEELEEFHALFEVVRLLDRLGVRYLIGGSLASSLHGIPRSTLDADLVADLKLEHAPTLASQLSPDFYVDEDRVRKAVRERSSFNVIFFKTMFKVDVFVLKDDPFSQEEMRRRKVVSLGESGGKEVYVASAEDTVLRKLLWHRMGGGASDRQWNDIVGVLQVSGKGLDFDYLLRWARQLGLRNLLQKACLESGMEGFDGK